MHNRTMKTMSAAFLALSLAGAATAQAQEVTRLGGGNPKSPIAQAVTVPPGYTTYYVSGTPGSQGDTHAQTIASLARIKETLTTLGLTFGDVVKATVFLVGDPAKGGDIDFMGMNQAWSEAVWHRRAAQQAGALHHQGRGPCRTQRAGGD